ncbi:MAG: tRNA (adenosine(37)-N6)-threonylcarbamoyltransferase complex ATPase subunit type 1 TsaE [Acidimicrobiales bacterium]
MSVVVRTNSPESTRAVAAAVAATFGDGDLVVLAGDLGAGKTCFTQGVALGLGIDGRVTSPTFTLHNRYEGSLVLNHLDVYRLDDLEETLDLDLPELLEEGVTVIEWGEQIDPVLPADHLVIRLLLADADNDRRIEFYAGGPRWTERIPAIATAIAAVAKVEGMSDG